MRTIPEHPTNTKKWEELRAQVENPPPKPISGLEEPATHEVYDDSQTRNRTVTHASPLPPTKTETRCQSPGPVPRPKQNTDWREQKKSSKQAKAKGVAKSDKLRLFNVVLDKTIGHYKLKAHESLVLIELVRDAYSLEARASHRYMTKKLNIAKNSTSRALKSLTELGLIIRTKAPVKGQFASVYALCIDPITGLATSKADTRKQS